jgi:molybdate transport system substrate-binding protein
VRLEFIAAGASNGLVTRVAAESGVEVAGHFGAVGAMLERFLGGEPADVVILTDRQIADLASRARVRPETCADLGSVATSIAVKEGMPVPDVGGEAPLRETLRSADAIYFPDPAKATAGIHFAKVIERLGLREETAAKLRIFPNGSTAMREMGTAAGRPIGCTQATEILATKGVRLVAPLPKGFDLETVYTAAVSAGARQDREARAFVERLTSEASAPHRSAAGFRGHAIRPATAADLPPVRDVVHRVLAEYKLEVDPGGTDSDLGDLDASYFSRGGHFDVVVSEEGHIAGCCGVYRMDDTTCELRKMYLRRDARRHGVGGRLLRRALAFAKGRGYQRMELETASVLKKAIALYTGAGFRPIERKHLADRCDQAFALDL